VCAATDTALEEVEVAGRCSVAKLWRGGDVARRLVEAVFAFADRFGPASVYRLTPEYNGPARSLHDTVAHRTSFVVYRPELGLKISHSTAERRLPWADPLRCAEEFAVFAGFTQAYWFVPSGVLSGSMAMCVGATGG
jgi:hypothetical protein